MGRLTFSVVVPVFNEEPNIDEFLKRTLKVMGSLEGDFEIVFVDDGSTDSTFKKIMKWSKDRKEVRGLRFSRNFGHQAAITAGIDEASGDAVIVMDGDLQHPPELIPELVKAWRNGYNIVNTKREETEGIPLGKKLFSKAFYKIINIDSEVPIPADAADFRLMDRASVEAFKKIREQDRFVRGLTSWIGFSQASVPYRAEARHSGKTKYSFAKMLKFAANGITSFSTLPLKFVGYMGLFVASLSFAYACYALYVRLVLNIAVEGWTSMLVGMLFLGGVQLIGIGVLGAYIARIFRQVKNRPLYIVRDRTGGSAE
ncbi:MAG: glycosyltransferase [Deltaproteobacteria bacterium]|nr:glycosyltransferase [Deltaproteobacteria bacterium]